MITPDVRCKQCQTVYDQVPFTNENTLATMLPILICATCGSTGEMEVFDKTLADKADVVDSEFNAAYEDFMLHGGFSQPCISEDVERSFAMDKCKHGLKKYDCKECKPASPSSSYGFYPPYGGG